MEGLQREGGCTLQNLILGVATLDLHSSDLHFTGGQGSCLIQSHPPDGP